MKFETANDVLLRVEELRETKRKDLRDIETRRAAAQQDLAFAKAAINAAAASLDEGAYEEALSKKKRAESTLSLCDLRSRQLQGTLVPEEESDETIAFLLACEDELAAKFRKDLSAHFATLEKLLTKYRKNVQEVEDILSLWTREVYPNYKAPNSTRTLPDGTRTSRMDSPRPVHERPYGGCEESIRLQAFLTQEKRQVPPIPAEEEQSLSEA